MKNRGRSIIALEKLSYELVQVVPKEISAVRSSMAIVDSEKRSLWPKLDVFFVLRLHDVQNDRDSVFVVVPDYPLVCVGSVGLNDAVSLD